MGQTQSCCTHKYFEKSNLWIALNVHNKEQRKPSPTSRRSYQSDKNYQGFQEVKQPSIFPYLSLGLLYFLIDEREYVVNAFQISSSEVLGIYRTPIDEKIEDVRYCPFSVGPINLKETIRASLKQGKKIVEEIRNDIIFVQFILERQLRKNQNFLNFPQNSEREEMLKKKQTEIIVSGIKISQIELSNQNKKNRTLKMFRGYGTNIRIKDKTITFNLESLPEMIGSPVYFSYKGNYFLLGIYSGEKSDCPSESFAYSLEREECFKLMVSKELCKDKSQQLFQEGRALQKRNELERALEKYVSGVELMKQFVEDQYKLYSKGLERVGKISLKLKEYSLALENYEERGKVLKKFEGQVSLEYAQTLYQIAKLTSDKERAYKILEEGIEISRKGQNKLLCARISKEGALIFYAKEQPDFKKAIESFSSSLKFYEQVNKEDTLQYAQVCYNLGNVYKKDLSSCKEGLECYEKSIRIKQNLGVHCINERKNRASIYSDILGRFDKSAHEYELCLKEIERFKGKDESSYREIQQKLHRMKK